MNLIKRIFYFRNNLLIYLLFVFFINFFLIQLPLTGAFGYEFSAINGLLLTIIAGLQTLNFLRRSDYQLKHLLINLSILILIPFLLSVFKSLLTMFCSFIDGLLFYLLIVITSTMFGVSLGFIIDLFFTRFKRIIFFVIIFVVASVPVIEIYLLPQVYFYSPLIGFFPGNIYDEGLSPDWKLFVHQLIICVIGCASIFSILKFRSSKRNFKLYISIGIIITFIIVEFGSAFIGLTTTFSKLDSVLNKKIESKNFCMHYDSITNEEAKFIALSTEYYFLEISKELKVNPGKQVQIYIFNNRVQKKELFGAGNADVAKPWQYAIYISADSWESTLKHELVHVFSAEFGTGLFKLASGFNPALIEGIAEAIEGTTDNYSLTDFTALAYNNNHSIDLKSLFTGLNFFKSNSSLSYTYSGAFIKYLIDEYDIEKVKIFYASGELASIFNKSLEKAEIDFKEELEQKVSIGNQAMADYYFGRLSILQKVCPRFISDRLKTAFEHLNNKKYYEAEELFNQINLKAVNYSAIIGLSEIYTRQNKLQNAIDLLSKNLNIFNRTPYYYYIQFKLADLYTLQNKTELANNYYDSIVTENPNYSLTLLSKVRKSFLDKSILADYIDADDSTMYQLVIQLNDTEYNYNSIPLLISLARNLEVKREKFIKEFNRTFIVNNLESSYAAFKLSEYLQLQGDYLNGRKYAALSLRYKESNPFYFVMQQNLKKATWLNNNYIDVLKSLKYSNVDSNN